jgi:hypothetical protein
MTERKRTLTGSECLRHIERAAKKRTYLLKISDVLGYAVGYRERAGQRTNEPALVVYVRRGRKRHKKQRFPRHQQIPERIRWRINGKPVWLPVDLVEVDEGRLQSSTPLLSGESIGNRRVNNNTGTIGWVARRSSDNQPVMCGNYHVFLTFPAHSTTPTLTYPSAGQPQEFVTSPSVQDGGNANTDAVGTVIRGRRDQLVDIAVALPARPDRPITRKCYVLRCCVAGVAPRR